MKNIETKFICDGCGKATVTMPGAISDSTIPQEWVVLKWERSLGTTQDLLCPKCHNALRAYMANFALKSELIPHEQPPAKRRRIDVQTKAEVEHAQAQD